MKIRNGFVSNSSSSSFVVIMKNGKKLDKSELMNIFGVDKKSPLYNFSKDLSNWMVNNLKEYDIKKLHKEFCYSKEDLTDEEMINDIVENYSSINKEDLEKVVSNEYKYYYGSASNDSGNAIEYYLCEATIKVETNDIKIISDGGY